MFRKVGAPDFRKKGRRKKKEKIRFDSIIIESQEHINKKMSTRRVMSCYFNSLQGETWLDLCYIPITQQAESSCINVPVRLVSVAPSFPPLISVTIFFTYSSPLSSSSALLFLLASVANSVSRRHSPVRSPVRLCHLAIFFRACGSIGYVKASSLLLPATHASRRVSSPRSWCRRR